MHFLRLVSVLAVLAGACSTGRNTAPAPSADDPATNGKGVSAASNDATAPAPAPAVPPAATAPATPAPAAAPVSGPVTYTAHIAPYIKSACFPCHIAGSQAPALDTYAAAQAGAAASIADMTAGRMPLTGKPAQSDIDNFNAWITAGKPN